MLGIIVLEFFTEIMWWDWIVIGLWNVNCTIFIVFKEWLFFCILLIEKNKGVDVRVGDN